MNDHEAKSTKATLPTGAAARKSIPIMTGVMDYFPDAIAEVAILSRIGNDQHNPGQVMHWAKDKSTDHANCIARHAIERGTRDPVDKVRHSTKLAWRALALLQRELDAEVAAKGHWTPSGEDEPAPPKVKRVYERASNS